MIADELLFFALFKKKMLSVKERFDQFEANEFGKRVFRLVAANLCQSTVLIERDRFMRGEVI